MEFSFFGFTQCPDICPTTMNELKETYKLIHKVQNINFIMISIDTTDTQKIIDEYVKDFNSNFKGVSGYINETLKLGQDFNISSIKVKNGLFDHSSSIILIDPNEKYYGFFNSPHESKNIAKDLNSII